MYKYRSIKYNILLNVIFGENRKALQRKYYNPSTPRKSLISADVLYTCLFSIHIGHRINLISKLRATISCACTLCHLDSHDSLSV